MLAVFIDCRVLRARKWRRSIFQRYLVPALPPVRELLIWSRGRNARSDRVLFSHPPARGSSLLLDQAQLAEQSPIDPAAGRHAFIVLEGADRAARAWPKHAVDRAAVISAARQPGLDGYVERCI